MYYNLEKFGEKIRNIRINLKLTQKDVSTLIGVSIDTFRKIENGKVIPRQETLDLMSFAYFEDLNRILLKYRISDYEKYHNLRKKVEFILESRDYKDLEKEIKALNAFLHNKNNNINTYFFKLTKQLCLLAKSIILKINDKNYKEALNVLIKSLKITTPNFSLTEYENFVYNNMEIRILMNIALILNKVESKNKCLEILLFCLNSLEPGDVQLYIKVCYNLSHIYQKFNLHKVALYYSNLGIEKCIQNRTLNSLAHLYYQKGIAEYHLEHEKHIDSLLRAKTLFEISGQTELINLYMNPCKTFTM